jgi:cyclic pyranopterin monophosphate synthase
LEAARIAGLFAVKKTSEMIPDCHPLPVEYTDVRFHIEEDSIRIELEVHTVYKTGVEVEAMHAASVVALTMYDMLKPIDKEVTIEQIKLVKKTGGKSDTKKEENSKIPAAVVVCSDSISKGIGEDKSGKLMIEKLKEYGVEASSYHVIADEAEEISRLVQLEVEKGTSLILFTGGTGLSPRDITPETLEKMIERRIPGIEEAIRNYGQQRTPYAMLSRSIAGVIAETLIIAFPGSLNGVEEGMNAVFPAVIHVFKIMNGQRH